MSNSFANGQALLKAGNKQQAIQSLKQAINEEPKNPAIWVELANAIDDIEKKKECLKQALRVSSNYPPAQLALAKLEMPQVAPTSPVPDWFDQPPVSNSSVVSDDPFAFDAPPVQSPSAQQTPPNYVRQTPTQNQISTMNIPAWIWAIIGVASLALVAGLISLLYAMTSDGGDGTFIYTISNLAGSILYAALFVISSFLAFQAVQQLQSRFTELGNPIISILIFIALSKLTTDALYKPLSNLLYSSTYGEVNYLSFGTQCLEGLIVIGTLLAGSYYFTRNKS